MSRSQEQRLLQEAQGLIGLQITGVRYMTAAESRQYFVDHRGIVLTLSDGSELYPMADDEQNDVGVLIARTKEGREKHLSLLDR